MHSNRPEPRLGLRKFGLRLRDLPDLELAIDWDVAYFGEKLVLFALLRVVGTDPFGFLE